MYQRIAVKVGSNVLTKADGTLDVTRLSALVDQLSEIHAAGIEVILISSGAVASGRGEMHLAKDRIALLDEVAQRQLFSAVGQAKLINRYYDFLREHHIPCGQVLCQKENFTSPEELKNMRSCIEVMLRHGVLPVVNENDVVSITELMFTDNDELSGLVAGMVGAEALVILTNVDGVYDGPPDDPASKVIPRILPGENLEGHISAKKSSAGRGGMLSKCQVASRLSEQGIRVIIANGNRENVLPDIMNNPKDTPHTEFVPTAAQA